MVPQKIFGRGYLFVSDFYIYIYINIYRVPFIFDSSRVITPTTRPMAKPQPTVTRPLVHLAPVHRCARSVCCFVCAVSWATWLLFAGVPCRGVPSLCCPRCMCVCRVLANVAPDHQCARCVRCGSAVRGCVPLPPPLIFYSVFFLCPASSIVFF